MKILVVTGTFPPRKYGGVTNVSYNISKKLSEMGHDVTVYTTDLGNYPNERLNIKKMQNECGINVHYFKNFSNYLAFKHRIFLPLRMFFKLRKEVNKFDIIHLHDFRSILGVMVYYYSKKHKIPFVLQAHGSIPYLSQKNSLKNIFDKLWGYKILKNADKLFALTNTESNQYKKMGVKVEKIEIIPNGINLSNYQKLPEKGEFKKKYHIKKDEKVILYLGRLYGSKGIEMLIITFSKLINEYITIKLIIAGPDDGNLIFLKELVNNLKLENKVLFTGPIYKKEKIQAYVDADVFVTPSFSGFPITFLEACACGTPIVTTNKGDQLNWIDSNVGYVVKYDKDNLKDAISNILFDDNLKKKFGFNGKKLVKTKFNWQIIADHIEKVYYEVIG
jgi:glycosyltransferase involved in cell wall biosynthesis